VPVRSGARLVIARLAPVPHLNCRLLPTVVQLVRMRLGAFWTGTASKSPFGIYRRMRSRQRTRSPLKCPPNLKITSKCLLIYQQRLLEISLNLPAPYPPGREKTFTGVSRVTSKYNAQLRCVYLVTQIVQLTSAWAVPVSGTKSSRRWHRPWYLMQEGIAEQHCDGLMARADKVARPPLAVAHIEERAAARLLRIPELGQCGPKWASREYAPTVPCRCPDLDKALCAFIIAGLNTSVSALSHP